MIRIERGLPDEDRAKAAALFWDAFGGKLGRCLGPEHKALRFLEGQMRPQSSFAAYQQNTLLGLVGFKTEQGGFIGGEYRDLAQIYGPISATWRGVALSMFGRDIEDGQLLLDGIFVSAGARGQGIGTALLGAIDELAQYELCHEIRLDVIDTNTRARALYERHGYVASGSVKTGLLRPVLGFELATTMIKTL